MAKIEIDEDVAKDIAKFLMTADVPSLHLGEVWMWVCALTPGTTTERRKTSRE
jgi:hypothetical protein